MGRAKVKEPIKSQVAVPPEAPPAHSSITKFLPWAILAVVILFAGAVRIRLLDIPLERDEGEYAYAGQLLLQGVPPYQAAFNMKFPGVYAAYAVMMAAFGETIAGIHLGFLVLNAGTIVLIFLLGRRLFSTAAGVASAAAYALLSLGSGVLGIEGHANHLVVAGALGATLLLLRAADSGSGTTLLLSGFLYGVTILMKQHGVFFAVFGASYLIGRGGRRYRDLAIFSLGLALPFGLTVAALWRAGVLSAFWFWTFTYAREYVRERSFADGMSVFLDMFPRAIGANLLLWLLAAFGLVLRCWRKEDRTSGGLAAAFLVFSFLAVCPGWYFREQYFILMLPAVALLAGAAISPMVESTWFLFGAVLVMSIVLQSDYLFRWSPVQASRHMYGVNNPFPEAIEVGDYLRTHASKAARIAVMGSEPEIYFYARRRSATGYLYTYGMMEHQPFALTMQEEMIHDLETVRPEYVVYVNLPPSWLNLQDSQLKIIDWWNAYGPNNYDLVGVVEILSADRTDYHWDHLEPYVNRAEPIMIFKRKAR